MRLELHMIREVSLSETGFRVIMAIVIGAVLYTLYWAIFLRAKKYPDPSYESLVAGTVFTYEDEGEQYIAVSMSIPLEEFKRSPYITLKNAGFRDFR